MFHYYAKDQFKEDEIVAIKRIEDNRDEQIHDHDFIEIVFVVEGSGTHYINGKEYRVVAGDLLFVNYGCTHSFTIQDNFLAYNLAIKLNYFTSSLLNDKNLFYILSLTSLDKLQAELDKNSPLIHSGFDEYEELHSIFKNIEREQNSEELAKSITIESYINLLLIKIFRKAFRLSNDKKMFSTERVVDYLRANLNKKLILNDVATRFFYNPAYFSRLFKKKYNMTFTDYVQDLRLEQSSALLRNTDKSVENIIEKCGFLDRNTFFEKFKEKYGCTPKEYKIMVCRKNKDIPEN